MSDIEDRLRELGERVTASAAAPELPSRDTLKRIRTRQRMAALCAVGVGAAIVGSLLMWGPSFHLTMGTAPGGTGGLSKNLVRKPRGPGSTPPGWVVHQAPSGVSIATPKRWTFTSKNPTKLLSPTIDFAIGTWRFPSGGSCAPTKALTSVPAKGMFLYMFEYPAIGKPGPFKPRPASFKLGPIKGPFECLGVRTHLISFRWHHGYYEVHIKFGPQASRSLRRKVVESLNTIAIARQ